MTADELSILIAKARPTSLRMSTPTWKKLHDGSEKPMVPAEGRPTEFAFDGVPVRIDETAIGVMFE
jgi:hypothetical protein